ncbi:hypothetical protein FDP41_004165 [Naegleria fowleri]|uniref:Uncharacterized protein n=1 Tax=Naegleria fowleri TaxID=5763 RepID=A0A6A5BSV4_NAEFO|nr:uncharacterized protein FDP41_004165 [Naegleria fowleri]KAF0976870.1 hypothetical protein FDP41_004165 [Naegleria fowleri]
MSLFPLAYLVKVAASAMIVVLIAFLCTAQNDSPTFNLISPGTDATYVFDDEELSSQWIYYKITNQNTDISSLSGIVESCSGRVNIYFKLCVPSNGQPCDDSNKWFPNSNNYDRKFVTEPTSQYQNPIGICEADPNSKCSSSTTYYVGITPLTESSSIRISVQGYYNEGKVDLITTDNKEIGFDLSSRRVTLSTLTYCASLDEARNCINELVPTPSFLFCAIPRKSSQKINAASVCGCRLGTNLNIEGCVPSNETGLTVCALDQKSFDKLENDEYFLNVVVDREDVPPLRAFAFNPVPFTYSQTSNVVGVVVGVLFSLIAVTILVAAVVMGVLLYRKKYSYQSI